MSIDNIRQRLTRAAGLYGLHITLTITTPEQYGYSSGTLARVVIANRPG
jgi:hypothetical protein